MMRAAVISLAIPALAIAAGHSVAQADALKIGTFEQGDTIDIGCLWPGSVCIVHMPGELFVEYQLAAQAMRPDLFVAMAAYGDYAPWYIGTEIACEQGGYETSPGSSLVAPGVEGVLMGAMRKLVDAEGRGPDRLGVEAAAREVEAARQRERPETGAN